MKRQKDESSFRKFRFLLVVGKIKIYLFEKKISKFMKSKFFFARLAAQNFFKIETFGHTVQLKIVSLVSIIVAAALLKGF